MLSIIIPTLNEQRYLSPLLEAISAQRLDEEHQIVITDAGSQDKTVRIAREHGCAVASGGLPAKGRNQGARAALGDLLLFLDPEALLPKNFIANALSEFRRRRLDVASCRIEPIVESWMPRFTFLRFLYDLGYNWPARLLEGVYPYASSLILVKSEVHERLGGFDEQVKIGDDHDYARRAARFGNVGMLRFGKLPLFMRRCQNEGIIKTHLKYQVCNLFNLVLGELRTDLLRYNFGQYKKVWSEDDDTRAKRGPVSQVLWTIAYYALAALGMVAWALFILALSPRLVKFHLRGLLRKLSPRSRRQGRRRSPSRGEYATEAIPVLPDTDVLKPAWKAAPDSG
jgi:glycosyltransferase involved in cell wall biosynthesis